MAKVYVKVQAIGACEPFDYDMNALKEAYNQEFIKNGVDAYVDHCRQITGTFSNHLIVDMSVASESPLPPGVGGLIIYLVGLVATMAAAAVFVSLAAALREAIFGAPPPEVKFYTPDGKEFSTLIEYITYMQNVYNPSQDMPYTCMYCGQGFATEEERDAHQEECPWKEGAPYPPAEEAPGWLPWVAGAVIILSVAGIAIVVLPRVLPREGIG